VFKDIQKGVELELRQTLQLIFLAEYVNLYQYL